MNSMRISIGLLACALALTFVAPAPSAGTLVVCAPGYPSDTEEAQPTMDELAGALARGAAWSPGRIAAVYHPSAEAGVEALSDPGAWLALVPLPFFLEYGERLGLKAWLGVEPVAGPTETWSLVAHRGAVGSPADLSGWEVIGLPGYSPRFVRRVALADWGELPADAQIRFGSRVLSALRGAARGEPIAVVLDTAQAESLDSLPFAAQLEIVARSRPWPGTMLCRVGDRLPDQAADELKAAFLGLGDSEEGRALLDTLRLTGFSPLDAGALERASSAFGIAGTRAR
jgi:hypothetical protein